MDAGPDGLALPGIDADSGIRPTGSASPSDCGDRRGVAMVRANLRRTRIMTLIAAVVGLAMMAFLTGCTPEVSAELRTYSGINAIRQQNGMRPLTPDPG